MHEEDEISGRKFFISSSSSFHLMARRHKDPDSKVSPFDSCLWCRHSIALSSSSSSSSPPPLHPLPDFLFINKKDVWRTCMAITSFMEHVFLETTAYAHTIFREVGRLGYDIVTSAVTHKRFFSVKNSSCGSRDRTVAARDVRESTDMPSCCRKRGADACSLTHRTSGQTTTIL